MAKVPRLQPAVVSDAMVRMPSSFLDEGPRVSPRSTVRALLPGHVDTPSSMFKHLLLAELESFYEVVVDLHQQSCVDPGTHHTPRDNLGGEVLREERPPSEAQFGAAWQRGQSAPSPMRVQPPSVAPSDVEDPWCCEGRLGSPEITGASALLRRHHSPNRIGDTSIPYGGSSAARRMLVDRAGDMTISSSLPARRPSVLKMSESSHLGTGSRASGGRLTFHFDLYDEWLMSTKLAAMMRSKSHLNLEHHAATGNLPSGDADSILAWGSSRANTTCKRFVLHPDRLPHLLWSFGSCVVSGMDVLTLPLTFVRDKPLIPAFVPWCVAIWWSLDIFVQLITGYHVDGLIELRTAHIMRRYARTGLLVDVPLALLDLMVLLAESLQRNAHGVSLVRLSRILRCLRLLRLARVVRLYKLTNLWDKLVDGLPSSNVIAGAKMFNVIILVVLVSHYIACFWCGLAHSVTSAESTWLASVQAEDADTGFKYALALHWSLAQFMSAPTEVKPMNTQECSFAIIVVLFALIIFSVFVGSLSSRITELRQLRSKELFEEARVRQYLASKRVSLSTGLRIKGYLKSKKTAETPLQESDVRLLGGIPLSLRSAMRAEVHMPVLSVHKLFLRASSISMRPIEPLCCNAMTEISCESTQDLFLEGQAAHGMYFVVSGDLEYRTPLIVGNRVVAGDGEHSWISEVALWGYWIHCGQMFARTTCSVTSLNAKKFRDAITKTYVQPVIAKAIKQYALAFAALVDSDDLGEPIVTDIVDDQQVCDRLVEAAFEVAGGLSTKFRTHTSNPLSPTASVKADVSSTKRSGRSESGTPKSSND